MLGVKLKKLTDVFAVLHNFYQCYGHYLLLQSLGLLLQQERESIKNIFQISVLDSLNWIFSNVKDLIDLA